MAEEEFYTGKLFKQIAKFTPNRGFLIDRVKGKGERRLTYKQTLEDVYRVCWALKDRGIKKGDMLALIGFNSIEQFEVCLSSFFTGWVYGCQNPILPEDWLVTIINDRMAAKMVFFDNAFREKVCSMMPRFKSVKHYVCLDGPADEERGIINYQELMSKYEPKEVEIEVEPNDIIALCMSGGTTGVPKAAMWTHEAYWQHGVATQLYANLGPHDAIILQPPLFWSTALPIALGASLLGGCKVVIVPGMIGYDYELVAGAITKEMAERFGVNIYDYSSLTEHWLLLSTDCWAHKGNHFFLDACYVEPVDPDTGEPVGPEELGEMVVTSLLHESNPLIRFGTDGMGILEEEKCDCGRTHPRIRWFGRSIWRVKVRDKVILPVMIQEIFERFPETREATLTLLKEKVPEMDKLRIRAAYNERITTDPAGLKNRLESEIKQKLGVETEITWIKFEELPIYMHKIQRVIEA